jgi:hypothetical protein
MLTHASHDVKRLSVEVAENVLARPGEKGGTNGTNWDPIFVLFFELEWLAHSDQIEAL